MNSSHTKFIQTDACSALDMLQTRRYYGNAITYYYIVGRCIEVEQLKDALGVFLDDLAANNKCVAFSRRVFNKIFGA